jgi:hypothetical protein
MKGILTKGCNLYVGKRKDGVPTCDVTEWKDKLLERNFTSVDPEIEIRKIASNKIKEIRLYLQRETEKWKMLVKQNDERKR